MTLSILTIIKRRLKKQYTYEGHCLRHGCTVIYRSNDPKVVADQLNTHAKVHDR